jgi:peptidoglycan/LPS O-acetylase OafA/YrhL
VAGTTGFPITREAMQRFGEIGSFGVRIFFVISGFLITTLLVEEHRKTGRISLGGFYLRRAFRIFPAAYTFIAVLFVLERLGLIETLKNDFLAAATYTMNFHRPKSTWMRHLWSLSVEEQFYMFWPAAVLVAGLGRARWIAALQIVAAPIIRVVIWFWFPEHRHFQHFWAVMDSIATGCLLALVRGELAAFAPYAALLRSRWFFVIPAGVVATMVAAEHSFAVYMAHDMVMNLGIAVCIDRFVTLPELAPGRFLNWAPMRYIGTLSYSLYLWQELFLDRRSPALVHRFPLNLALAFACGLVSYYLVEQPMLRLRARRFSGRRARDPRVAVAGAPAVDP